MKQNSTPKIKQALNILLSFLIVFSAWGVVLQSSLNPFSQETALAADVTIDSGIHATAGKFRSSQSRMVFTTDQVGYIFYSIDTPADSIIYKKTTDGGATWGSDVTVDSQTDAIDVSIWYDRWTPGDTTGTNIYIITYDTGSDDLWYNRLDTSTDTLESGTSPVSITSAPAPAKTNIFGNADDRPTITKATDGKLYVGMNDNDATTNSMILTCTSSCATASNWSDAGTNPLDSAVNNIVTLMPLSSGYIMVVRFDEPTTKWQSKVWNTSSWDASWTDIDAASSTANGTYFMRSSLTVNKITGDIYLAYTNDNGTLGSNDDIRTAIYSGGSWAAKADVVTNSSCVGSGNCGITGVKIGINENNSDIYVVYSARSTAGTAATGQIYYKKSVNNMTSWASEVGPINASALDTFGPNMTIMSADRLYIAWNDRGGTTMYGQTMVNLTPPTFEQSAYRFLANADSTTAGSALAATSTSVTDYPADQPFRLKMLMHVTDDGVQANYANFKLQYALSDGTCDTSFSGETYADVGSSGTISYYDNSTPTDGATAVSSNDPTHGADTVIQMTYEEANNFSFRTRVDGGQDALWDFSLVDRTRAAGVSYCFRLVRSGGSTLDTYSVVPTLSKPSLANVTRGGLFFSGGSKQGYGW